jgi:hypothetical protein
VLRSLRGGGLSVCYQYLGVGSALKLADGSKSNWCVMSVACLI